MAALFPAFALAQRVVGEITLIDGRATVTRVAQPSSAALQFRDNLHLGDRITLAEHSRVKILLFGKSVLTMQELSTLTITEEVLRPTLFLDRGKIDYAVPRDRMQPSEVHEIRTPNAFARVHGDPSIRALSIPLLSGGVGVALGLGLGGLVYMPVAGGAGFALTLIVFALVVIARKG